MSEFGEKILEFMKDSNLWSELPIVCGLPFTVIAQSPVKSKKSLNSQQSKIKQFDQEEVTKLSEMTKYILRVRARAAYYDAAKSCSVWSNIYTVEANDIARALTDGTSNDPAVVEAIKRSLLSLLTASRKCIHFPVVYDIFSKLGYQHTFLENVATTYACELKKNNISECQKRSIEFQTAAASLLAWRMCGLNLNIKFTNVGLQKAPNDLDLFYRVRNLDDSCRFYKVRCHGWIVKLLSVECQNEKTKNCGTELEWPVEMKEKNLGMWNFDFFKCFQVTSVPKDAWIFVI